MKRQYNFVRIIMSITFFVLFGIMIPYKIVSANLVKYEWNIVSISFLSLLEISAIKLCMMILQTKHRFLEISFWIFVLFWVGVSGFAQTLSNKFYWPGFYSLDIQMKGVFLIVSGVGAYQIGRVIYRHRRREPKNIQINSNICGLIINWRFYLAILVATLVSMWAVYQIGGIHWLFVGRETFSTHLYSQYNITSGLLLRSALQIPPFIALLFVLYFWRVQNKKSVRFSMLLLMIFMIAYNFVANSPIYISRYWLGTMVFSSVFVISKTMRTRIYWLIFLWGFGIAFAYPLLAQTRYITNSEDLFHLSSSPSVVENFYSGDFDVVQQTFNTVLFVEHRGISWGRNLLGAILFWVPREYWVHKPYGSGSIVASGLGYKFTNLSFPLWAEGYYAFGWLGSVTILLMYGYFSEHIDMAFAKPEKHGSLIYFFTIFFMPYQIFFLRGDLLNGIAYLTPVIAMMWFWLWSIRQQRPNKRDLVPEYWALDR